MTHRPTSTDPLDHEIRRAVTELAHAAPASPEFESLLRRSSPAPQPPMRTALRAARGSLVFIALATIGVIAIRPRTSPQDEARPPTASPQPSPAEPSSTVTTPAQWWAEQIAPQFADFRLLIASNLTAGGLLDDGSWLSVELVPGASGNGAADASAQSVPAGLLVTSSPMLPEGVVHLSRPDALVIQTRCLLASTRCAIGSAGEPEALGRLAQAISQGIDATSPPLTYDNPTPADPTELTAIRRRFESTLPSGIQVRGSGETDSEIVIEAGSLSFRAVAHPLPNADIGYGIQLLPATTVRVAHIGDWLVVLTATGFSNMKTDPTNPMLAWLDYVILGETSAEYAVPTVQVSSAPNPPTAAPSRNQTAYGDYLRHLSAPHMPTRFTPVISGDDASDDAGQQPFLVAFDPTTGERLQVSFGFDVDTSAIDSRPPTDFTVVPGGRLSHDDAESAELITDSGDAIQVFYRSGFLASSSGGAERLTTAQLDAMLIAIADELTPEMRSASAAAQSPTIDGARDLRRSVEAALTEFTGEDISGGTNGIHMAYPIGSSTTADGSGRQVKRFLFEALWTDQVLPDGIVTPGGNTLVGFRRAGQWQLVVNAVGAADPPPTEAEVTAMLDAVTAIFVRWSSDHPKY